MAESSDSRPTKRQRTTDPEVPQDQAPESERMAFVLNESSKQVVPVLPRFQADVPEWTNADPQARVAIPNGYENDPNTLKWLGTTTIAAGNNGMNGIEANNPAVGRGRPGKCNCRNPGSAYCVERHVEEERARLQAELGPGVCKTWGFDETDEEGFFWDWTLNDYRAFNAVVRNTRTKAQTKSFLTRAYGILPWKISAIYDYYVRFMVPGRIARESRRGEAEIDSDTDAMLERFVNRHGH